MSTTSALSIVNNGIAALKGALEYLFLTSTFTTSIVIIAVIVLGWVVVKSMARRLI